MRILFMGTPNFAVSSLEQLYVDGHDICGVFTQPDKPKNRGMKIVTSPVKDLATRHHTPVYQPVTLRDGIAYETLKALEPELIAVVAYGKILPQDILNIPKYGCVNIHGSILPKYRGSAPIQWAVLNGEKETGVTAICMSEEMDAGDILAIKKTTIFENETAGTLFSRLGLLGAELLSETVRSISAGRAAAMPQNHEEATFAPPLTKAMSPVDWTKPADVILNQIRGLNPWPVATANLAGINFKIYDAMKTDSSKNLDPGKIISAEIEGIEVACSGGSIIIKELQAPGGKRMNAADYLRGHPLCL